MALAQWDAERQVWIRVGDPLRRALHRVTGWRPWLEELLVNVAMIEAARRAEYDYLRGRAIDGDRFIPTPDAVIKAMLTAALELVEVETLTVEQPKKPAIVSARKPRARR